MLRKSTERKFIRSVISRVHPDLFEGHKEQQRVNTESLKELHKAVERLTEGHSADSVELNFYYREKDVSNGTFQFASVRLTDSLVPLYEVFGVISQEEAAELRSNEGQDARNLDDTNFLQWLEATIQEASVTARDLANRKEILHQLQSSMTNEFRLKKIRVGSQQGQSLLSVSDVLEQIDSLKIVQEALRSDAESSERLHGLSMRVHCPRNAPVRDYHWVDYNSGQDHHISTRRWAEISSLGEVEVVAHTAGVAERLRSLDLDRARQLGSVDHFWKARQDMLAKSVAESLHVKFVWPDENCSSREFCLWAGRVLQDQIIRHELAECQFSFNLLVHSDDQAPSASFLPSSSTVQVHHHCSPRQLLELLVSNTAIAASNTSGRRIETATAEGELLQRARDALGARHVVRICGRDKGDRVSAALQRLVDNAATIRKSVNLSDVCLAIDDNFHLWDSGYVSIPYDFDVQTVVKEVTRLLAPVTGVPSANSTNKAPMSQKEKEKVSDTAETNAAAKQAVPDAQAQPKQKKPLTPEEQQAQKKQDLVVAAGAFNEGGTAGYESSDEDVARVYAQHSSAAEFIKNLRDTDEESIGESIEDTDSSDLVSGPSANPSATSGPGSTAPAHDDSATPRESSAGKGSITSHPIASTSEGSGNTDEMQLDGDPPKVSPIHPAQMPMPVPLPAVAQSSDEEAQLQPLVAAVTNGGGEESLRAWLEGQSDCDMAGSPLIAGPGNSAELFGAAAYSGAGATTVSAGAAIVSSASGAAASAAIGPSVPTGDAGGGSAGGGSSGGNSNRGRSVGGNNGSGGSGRRKSSVGRFAAVAGTLTALPEPTLPPFNAQWDLTPHGRVGPSSAQPLFTTGAGPDAAAQDPSDRAAAQHALREHAEHSEGSTPPAADVNSMSKSSPEGDVAVGVEALQKGDKSKGGSESDTAAGSVASASKKSATATEKSGDGRQDFHTHVNDLLKAVRFVKQRHIFQNGGGGNGGDGEKPPAARSVKAAESSMAPKPCVRRGSRAAAEAAAEAAQLLLGSRGVVASAAANARRGRAHDRAVSPAHATSVPHKQRNVLPTNRPSRHVFAPDSAVDRTPHPTSFPRRNTNVNATASNKHAAADRMNKLFGARDTHKVLRGMNKRMHGHHAGASAPRPLQHLQRPTPAQPFHPAAANAAAVSSHTPAVRRSRSVSRASSLTIRNPSIEFEEFPSALDMPTYSQFPEDEFSFTETSISPPATRRAPRAARRNSSKSPRGRAHTALPTQRTRPLDLTLKVDGAEAPTPVAWRSASMQPQQSSDAIAAALTARDKRMSGNSGLHDTRDASCGRAGAVRSMIPPPIRGTTATTAAAAARAGGCRSLSRTGCGGSTFVQPLGGAVGPGAAAIGGGMWARNESATGRWTLAAAPHASRARHAQAYRSCSAARGRTPGAVLR